ncbi:MAG TPA: hypothetical protein VMG10_24455 [Gemmataceae bacterium]|nr:hypothetical protein [Gemmataceae bacterium]
MLDALIMGSVACDQLQAMPQGEGGDHRIGSADGLSNPVQIASNPARQFSGCLVEGDDLFGGNGRQELLQAIETLFLLEASYHFHDGDDRDGVPAEGTPVSGSVANSVGGYPFADLGQDVGVDQRFISSEDRRQGYCSRCLIGSAAILSISSAASRMKPSKGSAVAAEAALGLAV